MNFIMKLLFFMNSQIIFLFGITLLALTIEELSSKYYYLFGFYLFIFLFPILITIYHTKQTNGKDLKIKNIEQIEMKFQKSLLTIIGIILSIYFAVIRLLGDKIDTSFLINYIIFNIFHIIIGLNLILIIYFIFKYNHNEHWIFENFILLNILRYKILKVDIENSSKILLTRKKLKNGDLIKKVKHLFGGIYYY